MINISYSKSIPVIGEYDVIVAGSGPAGLAAAVSSARKGARTVLIERLGIVGGNLTSGYVGPIMGEASSGAIGCEILSKLKVTLNKEFHNAEDAKIILTNMVNESGSEMFLQTPVIDVIMEENAVTGLVVATKNGLAAVKGKIIIDATGDGIVSYMAGAQVMLGREGDGLVQPVTLMFTIANVDDEKTLLCEHEGYPKETTEGKFILLCEQKAKEGELPPNVTIVRLYRTNRKGERMINATQENHINGLDIKDIARAEIALRNQIVKVYEFIKKYVPGCEECHIKGSADVLGIRESRRIKGEYVLQDLDLINGRKFEDVMVHNAQFVIDIHNPDGGGQAEGLAVQIKPYDIPYGCFVPEGIDNLYTAGRCISGTHRAHASYRVMNICMAMGQAVGTGAALAAETGVTPRRLNYKLIQEELTSLGVKLYD